VVGALALAKQQFSHDANPALTGALVVYAIFAACFAWLVFGRGAACKAAAPGQSGPG
jgi:hypothetical protein